MINVTTLTLMVNLNLHLFSPNSLRTGFNHINLLLSSQLEVINSVYDDNSFVYRYLKWKSNQKYVESYTKYYIFHTDNSDKLFSKTHYSK